MMALSYMPPSLQQDIPVIAFSKNPIALKVHSDSFRSSTPAFAVTRLTLQSAIAVDDTLGLTWKVGSATFKAKAAPDDSGLQIPTGAGDNAHATALLAYFQSNPFIDRDFDVSLDTAGAHPVFLFTARVFGSDYNIGPVSATNYLVATVTAGVGSALLPNFMHYICVQILSAGGVDWQTVYNYNVPLDNMTSGTTSIDIAGILHPYLSLDMPKLTGSIWQACSNSIRKFKVKFAAFFGDPGFIRKLQKLPAATVVYGGYSNLALQQTGGDAFHLQKYLLPADALYKYQRWFEAWPVDRFTVKTNQPQFLYFINSRSIAETYKIKVDLTFENGDLLTIYRDGGTLAPQNKVCVGCGYKQLGLSAYTSGAYLVSSYKIQLVESATLERRSRSKYFVVDRAYEAYTRYFLYSDSAGNFKTLRTFGTSQLTAETTADQVNLQTDPAAIPTTGNYRNTNIKSVHNDKLNTGYITSADAYDSLIELHQAKQVFRVFGKTLVPVVMTSKNFNYSADGTLLNADLLEYRLAYDDDLYTASSYALPVPQLNQSQQSINDI